MNALQTAGKLLASGKLRQAESAYRELVERTPTVDAYRGLARTAVAVEDTDAALATLLNGATVLARAGDRSGVVALLQDAVGVAPDHLAAHRRLGASLAIAGDLDAACAEYARFAERAIARGDAGRAWLEVTYARETLGETPGVMALVREVAQATGQEAPEVRSRPERTKEGETGAVLDLLSRIGGSHTQALPERAKLEQQLAKLLPVGTPSQAAELADRRATLLLAANDPRATEATLDAVRRLFALEKYQAASDLLLSYIAAGFTDREAQRLLIEAESALGQKQAARDRCKVLGTAYRIDGNFDLAVNVERLAAVI